jgi:predicted DNA-binding transcriptional regulator AlpA
MTGTRNRAAKAVGEGAPDATARPPKRRVAATLAQDGALPSALTHFDDLPDSAYVRLPVVIALFSRSASSVWRDVQAGRLPAPRKLGPRCSAWNVGELRAVLHGDAE